MATAAVAVTTTVTTRANATVTPGLLDQHQHEHQHQHQHHHEQQLQHQHHHEHEDNCLCDSNTNGITIVDLTIAYVIVIAVVVLITLMVSSSSSVTIWAHEGAQGCLYKDSPPSKSTETKMAHRRDGGFLPAEPTITRNGREQTTPSQVVCFICQRITAAVFHGKTDAFQEAGVWFLGQDSMQKICWCPSCQFVLQEPDAAHDSWRSRDPRWKTDDWEKACLTEEQVTQFMRNWRDPEGGPQPSRPLRDILEEESRQGEATGRVAPPPPPGDRPPASEENVPPPPPPQDRPLAERSPAAIEDIQGGVGPRHGAEGADGAPRSSTDSSSNNQNIENLEKKIQELSRALENQQKVVRDAYTHILLLHNENAELKEKVSELKNAVEGTDGNAHYHIAELRKEISELKEAVQRIDEVGSKNQELSTTAAWEITQLKQTVAQLEQNLRWSSMECWTRGWSRAAHRGG